MVAGTDTSSVTLTFCLLLLLNNPDKLAKLAQELDEAFPSRNDPITFEKTLNLPYLNAALSESMRAMPVAVGMLLSVWSEICTSHRIHRVAYVLTS